MDVTDPPVHDALVWKIEIGNRKDMYVHFRTDDRKREFKLCLRDVEYFNCDEFKEGNIVFSVETVCGIEIDEANVEKYLDIPSLVGESYAEKSIARIRSGDRTYVLLIPTYGCAISCLCREANWEEEGDSAVPEL